MLASTPTGKFLLYYDGHCAGIIVENDGTLVVSDSAYPNKMRLTIRALQALIAKFTAANDMAIFKSVANPTRRAPSHDRFLLVGDGDRNAGAPFRRLPPKKGKGALYVTKVLKEEGPPPRTGYPICSYRTFGRQKSARKNSATAFPPSALDSHSAPNNSHAYRS